MDRYAAVGAIKSPCLLCVMVRLCHLMSQLAVRAGKNHLRFGLVDYSQSMPPDSPRQSAAIEVTDARSMAHPLTAMSSIPGPDRTGRSALSVRLTFPRLPRANASSTPP